MSAGRSVPSGANDFAHARENADAYVRHLYELLGERDPWTVQEELVPWLERRLADLGERECTTPERPGKWSVHQVVCHLADGEVVYAYRVRKIVAQPETPIDGFDQDAWARELDYTEQPLEDALAVIATLRRDTLRLLRRLGEEKLARAGLHAERGLESARKLVDLEAGHDLLHRRQIERILAAVNERARR